MIYKNHIFIRTTDKYTTYGFNVLVKDDKISWPDSRGQSTYIIEENPRKIIEDYFEKINKLKAFL